MPLPLRSGSSVLVQAVTEGALVTLRSPFGDEQAVSLCPDEAVKVVIAILGAIDSGRPEMP